MVLLASMVIACTGARGWRAGMLKRPSLGALAVAGALSRAAAGCEIQEVRGIVTLAGLPLSVHLSGASGSHGRLLQRCLGQVTCTTGARSSPQWASVVVVWPEVKHPISRAVEGGYASSGDTTNHQGSSTTVLLASMLNCGNLLKWQ